MANRMCGEAFDYDDPIFNDFHVIGGKGVACNGKEVNWPRSFTIIVLDADNEELVFAAKITDYQDLKDQKRNDYEELFKYFKADWNKMHGAVTRNASMKHNGRKLRGKMGALGWRATMGQKGQKLGKYALKLKNPEDVETFLAHVEKEKWISNLYRESYLSLAPSMLASQAVDRAEIGAPAFGDELPPSMHGSSIPTTAMEEQYEGIEWLKNIDFHKYFSNLAYTFGTSPVLSALQY